MKKNTTGVKVLKSILFFLAGFVIFAIVIDNVFSLFGPMVQSLPFETPTNFIVADYIGISLMFLSGLVLLFYTKKWMWR